MSIQQLTERTGIPQATLRTWEARYGFPQPTRLAGGHRRYGEGVAAAVAQVVRLRETGLALEAAIRQVKNADHPAPTSVFAELRRRHPRLMPQVISKPLMLALSRAIEDECCAQAQRPILFASFQKERFYRSSQPRWVELARTARSAVVFADFPRPAADTTAPLEVAVPYDAPINREWALVCDAPDYPACLVGWEPLGQTVGGDSERRFEALWSVDPVAVRDAARVFAALSAAYRPESANEVWDELGGEPPAASGDLHRASTLFTRMLGHFETALELERRR